MKVISCEDCGDIIAPYERARRPRLCVCKSHAVWWEDPARGIIRVAFVGGHPAIYEELKGHPPGRPRVWILGITNALLHHKGVGTPSADAVQVLIDAHDDSYIFKRTRSLIIRVRPGQSSDSDWGYIPREQMETTQTRKEEEAANMQRAANTARKDELRQVINFLYSTKDGPDTRELVKQLEAQEHHKMEDPG